MADEKKKGPGLFGYVKGFGRMWGALAGRTYRKFPWRTVAGTAFSAVYVISPLDIVPELLMPVFGFVDDAAVLGLLAAWIKKDVDRFMDWESAAGK